MPQHAQTLDRAQTALRRSVARVRRAPRPLEPAVEQGAQPAKRRSSALDQSVAALQAVVWIAAFVQSVFNEIRGRSDEL